MVIGPFPVAKLGFLFFKTISKPLANVWKEKAKRSPFFRKYICLPPAYFYNWCEVKAKMRILNLGQSVQVPPLNEAMAIELGANLLGEGIIFAAAAVMIIAESKRQAWKQATKDAEHEEEMKTLNLAIRDLTLQVETQQAELRELFRHVYDLDTRVVKLPWTSGEKPLDPKELSPKQNNIENSSVISNAISYLVQDILGFQSFSSNT